MVDIGDRARSREGHAAMSMRGGDDRWIQIQQNTFVNWVNEQLREVGESVEDVTEDFDNGIKLCLLMEHLRGKKVGRVIKKPINQHQWLENVTLALRAMQADNIKLVNIGAEDIVNGNRKLILGMIWHLILRYQIGKTKFPPKKLMLAWINAVAPDCHITNFSRDWNDGIALNAVLDYCKPGLSPDWRVLSRHDGLNNCRNAMELAQKEFDIPLVVRPEDLSSPDMDDLSGMTYLSYFMKLDSPGYHATLRWVRGANKYGTINNFTTDWQDGYAACSLVQSLGGNVLGWPDVDRSDPVGTTQLGIDGGRRLGVEPILTAAEMVDSQGEHLGNMAYAASFQHATPTVNPSEQVSVTTDLNNVRVGQTSHFLLNINDDELDSSDIRVEVVGPSGKIPASFDFQGSQAEGTFIAQEAGPHKLNVFCKGQLIQDCPRPFMATGDKSKVHVSNLDTCTVGALTEFNVNAIAAGDGSVRAQATAPSGRFKDVTLVGNDGNYRAEFQPDEVGDWGMSVFFENEHIRGSPFNVKVFDPSAVKISGLESGTAGQQVILTADCSEAGEGDLACDVRHNSEIISTSIHNVSSGRYHIAFTPPGGGKYQVYTRFGGREVKGSPHTLEIVDSNQVIATGEGLGLISINRETSFDVNAYGAHGGDIAVEVTGPTGRHVMTKVYSEMEGFHKVAYTPIEVGEHHIVVKYAGQQISGSPFVSQSYDKKNVLVNPLSPRAAVGQPVEFEIDAIKAGSGNLEIMINNGTIPCSVQNQGNRRFVASYVPKQAITHNIEMKFNGEVVPGSPWSIDTADTSSISATGPFLNTVPVDKMSYFEIQTGPGGHISELDISITSPSQTKVSHKVTDQGNGVYKVECTPSEIGPHSIDVNFFGQQIPGSPFSCRVYNFSAIRVGQIPTGILSKPVEFEMDVSQAGEGSLEIMINDGSVPNSVQEVRPGAFVVKFVPIQCVTHFVAIKFNDNPVPGSPFVCKVIDASLVTTAGLTDICNVHRLESFSINTHGYTEGQIDVTIIAPSGKHEAVKIHRVDGKDDVWRVQYTPTEIGTYTVNAEFAGTTINGSPFSAKVHDTTKVKVTDFTELHINKPATFVVDASQAGEGSMEIAISAEGKNIENRVSSVGRAKYLVEYTPTRDVPHQAAIIYNGIHVPGSPFSMQVQQQGKPEMVRVMGNGAHSAFLHKNAEFLVDTKQAGPGDLIVTVRAPDQSNCHVNVIDTGNSTYRCEWTPHIVGDHRVDISYAGLAIKDSPFTARVCSPADVRVTNVGPGRRGKPTYFNLDASKAGPGNLEIIVSADGNNVPNYVKPEGNARFEVSYTPEQTVLHTITVRFNNEHVPGSPYACNVIDGSACTISGDMLYRTIAHRQAHFSLNTQGAGEGDCEVEIFSPSGMHVPARISGSSNAGYRIEFTPEVAGRHQVHVKYADTTISGSPFTCSVWDISQVKFSGISAGKRGERATVEIDCTRAGEGDLSAEIRCKGQGVPCDITARGQALYQLSFVPQSSNTHNVDILFNDEQVPGSPFDIDIKDDRRVVVTGDAIRSAPIAQQSYFQVSANGADLSDLNVRIVGPSQTEITNYTSRHSGDYRVEFTPREVGGHHIHVALGQSAVIGSPFTCYVYDAGRVRVRDISDNGIVGKEMHFVVDASEAGQGDIDAEVTNRNRLVRTTRENLGNDCHRYSYIPEEEGDHTIDVTYNYEKVRGSPFLARVTDPTRVAVIRDVGVKSESSVYRTHDVVDYNAYQTRQESNRYSTGHVIQTTAMKSSMQDLSSFLISLDGAQYSINDLQLVVTAPNGEQVPAKIIKTPNGEYKVEYSTTHVGRHTIDIYYNGQRIGGSPYYVDVFDPQRVRVEKTAQETFVNQETGLHDYEDSVDASYSLVTPRRLSEVFSQEAGRADLTAKVFNPSGVIIASQILDTANGTRIAYKPTEYGIYKIYAYYGGVEVPGCPIIQEIRANQVNVTVHGDGLYSAVEGSQASFFVDSQGAHGDLFVQVDGPNSIAKCNIVPERQGYYRVTYTPVECGTYEIQVKWNGQPVTGSPFRPLVSDARRIQIIGGWESIMDSERRVILTTNQVRRIAFDTSYAGPGTLRAEVKGPYGQLLHIQTENQGSGQVIISFTPVESGLHVLSVFWGDRHIPGSPFTCFCQAPAPTIDHTKVVLIGQGVREAKVREETSFIIDGSQAGPGFPDVKISGVKADIATAIDNLGGDKYKCRYVPTAPGAYLLHVQWADRAVRDSPFKLNVIASGDASKVLCTGDGLKMGIMNRSIQAVIDTRRAGPGELVAQCQGPHMVAFCELYDHNDGTFTLNVKPQEPGKHLLHIRYGDENVPGSPFVLKIAGAPDASKVRVKGPGVEHGILATFLSRFLCETGGAGAGQLTVRIRGPKAAFRVEMQRESQKDRNILCRFDPTEVGDYEISVKWSGVDVPGSPFHIQIFDTHEELERFYEEQHRGKGIQNGHGDSFYNGYGQRQWNAEI